MIDAMRRVAMENKFNHKIEKIAVSSIRQFDAEASAIPGIIKLTLGEPDFNTPEHIKEAAKKAIDDNLSHYTPNAGIPELREATAAYFNEKYNLHYKPSQVITTIGATEGIATALRRAPASIGSSFSSFLPSKISSAVTPSTSRFSSRSASIFKRWDFPEPKKPEIHTPFAV